MKRLTRPPIPESLARIARCSPLPEWNSEEVAALRGEWRQHLLVMQRDSCVYCERPIDLTLSHIDHHQPQAHFSGLRFEWANLFASCQDAETCGHAKGSNVTPLIKPDEVQPRDHLAFSSDGSVAGRDPLGQQTVDILNLNERRLVARRREWLRTVLEQYNADDETLVHSVLREEIGEGAPFLFSAAVADVLGFALPQDVV